jgi:hypothetical protein
VLWLANLMHDRLKSQFRGKTLARFLK